jgi:hypothetical protein
MVRSSQPIAGERKRPAEQEKQKGDGNVEKIEHLQLQGYTHKRD